MRKVIVLTLFFSAAAFADPDSNLLRTLTRAQSEMDKGLALVSEAKKQAVSELKATRTKRRSTLRRAKSHLKAARIAAKTATRRAAKNETLKNSFADVMRKATDTLVTLLNTETEDYLARDRLSSARRRNTEARKLAPNDTHVKELKAQIDERRRSQRSDRDRNGKASGGGSYDSGGFNNRRRDLNDALGLGFRNRSRNTSRGGAGGGGRR